MSRAVELNEASNAHRWFRFHPPDPLWISSAAVDEARAALEAFDPRLNLWWSVSRRSDDPLTPGRWRVVEWLKSQNDWTTAFYLEGDGGSYRDPLPVGWILERLWRMAVNTEVASRAVEEWNVSQARKRRKEIVTNISDYENDLRRKRAGGRAVVVGGAPFGTRRHTSIESLRRANAAVLRDSNHAAYLRTLGLDPEHYMG